MIKKEDNSLKHLFQQEFSKMVAVISKLYGLQHMETAEDIVSETFLLAAETWGMKGIPPNPAAWLYTVAKQKTIHHFRRIKVLETKVIPELISTQPREESGELNFSPENIRDNQLQMLFAICNPIIASEAQIGLALRILCGFGIDEIAEAFLTNKETINKRLLRAKEKLRTEKIRMELPPEKELISRLDMVLHIIYLLFSEGYYSRTNNKVLRRELCLEALRLGSMLTKTEQTNLPKTNALMALMCFHASRFNARQTNSDHFVLYEQQDEALWDPALIERGLYYLNLAARGNELSSYHLEAGIAFRHCQKEDTPEKWEQILHLYNELLVVNYSPAVALNRTFALYKVKGAGPALEEAEKLNLENNHFYFLLLGQLYQDLDDTRAMQNLERALVLAKTDPEKKAIRARIDHLSRQTKSSS
ncbi:MAG: RNA polymerase sigma factor [Mangrovibacterium sp.]